MHSTRTDSTGTATASRARPLSGPTDKKPVHRDFMTDKDGAPIIAPLKSPSA
ncbi:hypothetical protein G3I19_10120 [Streptomyces sp. SID10853]|uniref:hypothetical protein n=1 Tax=Streptomyces sp. SID10853 TaxID=2706028 RepID=UPI0013BF615A|nr:hypothetical protein [Streptomyces sp. SID10853]NDZ78876.1 hypothetical protein [Streptomyces sp. SID10853]